MGNEFAGKPGALSRRGFIKAGSITTGVLLSTKWRAAFATSADNSHLAKFVQPLRDVTAGGIPLAAKDSYSGVAGAVHYTLNVSQYQDQLHPDQDATRLWGYGQGTNRHLGGIIVASRNAPAQVTFRNNLPTSHLVPVDTSIMGAERGADRISPHLHGGFVPWVSDGGPFAWWNSDGTAYGASFMRTFMRDTLRAPLGRGLAANEGEFYYPNQQGARLAWYHDHAIGTTRLNAYAGIASGYVITDDYEKLLTGQPFNLPGPLDPRTKYLIFQDKKFVSPRFLRDNPEWSGSRAAGDLGYADFYDDAKWALDSSAPSGTPPIPSVIPEFFGDTVLVNGTVAPYLEVEPRQYRLRILNACNARFLNPQLYYAKGAGRAASTEADTSKPGPFFVQIGTEGGFLPYPAVVANTGAGAKPLLIAPGERVDLLLDLRQVAPGATLILHANADAPYPGGDSINSYDGSAKPGFTPDTQNLLQLRVKARSGGTDAPVRLPAHLTAVDPPLVVQLLNRPTPVPHIVFVDGHLLPVTVKRKTLNESFDEYGRLIQRLGTDVATLAGTSSSDADFGRAYSGPLPTDAPTEVVRAGSVEVWEIVNLTGDTHPMHFHLVNVQVLSRQAFDASAYVGVGGGGTPSYTEPASAPDLNELGWKETVRCPPGYVTRVILHFTLPKVPFAVPASPRSGGHEYVWHCHILEHEEHDMMRPLIVTP